MQASVRYRSNRNGNNVGNSGGTTAVAAKSSNTFSGGRRVCYGNLRRRLGAAAMIVSTLPSSHAFGLLTSVVTGSRSTVRLSTCNLTTRVTRSTNLHHNHRSVWGAASARASFATSRLWRRSCGTNIEMLSSAGEGRVVTSLGNIYLSEHGGVSRVSWWGSGDRLSSCGHPRRRWLTARRSSTPNGLNLGRHAGGFERATAPFSTTSDAPPPTAPAVAKTDNTATPAEATANARKGAGKSAKGAQKKGAAVAEDTPVAELRTVRLIPFLFFIARPCSAWTHE